ncbi:unnamed protein product [Ilex paraguariensis]|uniref:Uncharacterized protein n=1 Tax=Ilex paraguariensis TaxID=185542 RepID=A0ABC8RAB7_9AQUA
MLHNRALQNCPSGTCIRPSTIGTSDKIVKFCQLKCKEVGVSCIFTSIRQKVLGVESDLQKFHLFISHVDRSGSRSGSAFAIQPQLRVGFPSTTFPMNAFSHGSSESGIRLGSPCYDAFAKRSFCQIPIAVTNKNDHVAGRSGGNNSSTKVFNKHWKQAKSMAAHRQNFEGGPQALGKSGSTSNLSALKDNVLVTSRDHLVWDGKKDVNLGVAGSHVGDTDEAPNAKGERKQKSRSKKSNSQSSDAIASSRAANQQKVSKNLSQERKPNVTNNNQSPLASAVSNLCV